MTSGVPQPPRTPPSPSARRRATRAGSRRGRSAPVGRSGMPGARWRPSPCAEGSTRRWIKTSPQPPRGWTGWSQDWAVGSPAIQRPLTRQCGRFAAEQFAHWIRLARGAGPGDPRGEWVDELVHLDESIEILDRTLAGGTWRDHRDRPPGRLGAPVRAGFAAEATKELWSGGSAGETPVTAGSVDMRRAYGVETIPQDAGAREALGSPSSAAGSSGS